VAPGAALLGIILVTGLLALAGWYQPSVGRLEVLAPMAAAALIVGLFLSTMARRTGAVPLDDLGFWHVGAVSLYVLLPLGIFLVLGMQYTPLNDLRLYLAHPSPGLVARVAWYHVTYLAAVAAVYLWVSRGTLPPGGRVVRITGELALAALLVWQGCELFFAGLGLFYQLSAASYLDSYVVVQRLPLFARQLYRLVSGIRVVASLMVLAWLFADFRKRRWLLAVWLAFVGVETVLAGGSRTAFMMLLVGSFILYHRMVQPVRLWVAATVAALGLGAFTALGIWRQAKTEEYWGGAPFVTGVSSGEFDAVFANALDLEVRRNGHEFAIRSPTLYLSEIFATVPSQLLPFDKTDLGNWYMSTFYPESYERGEGFAFGAVAQSLVGLGWIELLLRGALIGAVFGWLTRWYARHRDRAWSMVVYLWFTVLSYQAFRNSTGAIFSMFLQQFVPAAILIWALSGVLAWLRPRRRPVPVGA
jgi:hypothetical protein